MNQNIKLSLALMLSALPMKKIILSAIACLALWSIIIEPSAANTSKESGEKALAEKMVYQGCLLTYFGDNLSGVMTASKQKLSAYVKCLRAQNAVNKALLATQACDSFAPNLDSGIFGGEPIKKHVYKDGNSQITRVRYEVGWYKWFYRCQQKHIGSGEQTRTGCEEVVIVPDFRVPEDPEPPSYYYEPIDHQYYQYLKKLHALQVKAAARPAKTLPLFFKEVVYQRYAHDACRLSKLREVFEPSISGTNDPKTNK